MSGEKYIKQAIIAALCEHPDLESYRARAFSKDNLDTLMKALTEQSSNLTKADFFAPDDNGKYIIDTPGFWKNFDKIREIIYRNGDKLTLDDLTRPLGKDESRHLVRSATDAQALGKLFSVDVWQGRFEEMERAWYKAPLPARRQLGNDGLIPIDTKRKLYAAEGALAPEDGLAKAGLSAADIKEAFLGRGNFEELNRRLSQSGDYLRKEYLLLCDNSGSTVFAYSQVWDRYDDIVRGLQKHGEKMEVTDFIRQVSNVANILTRAFEHKKLDKVFIPAHWEGRLPEMIDLWSHVKEGWKGGLMKPQDFDEAYARAQESTYGKLIDFKNLHAKADLLQPLNAERRAGEEPVLPLGLRSFWDNARDVRAALSGKGETLTLEDLRLKSGQMGDTCLMAAAKAGRFDEVIEICRQSGQALALDDFLAKDSHKNTLLAVLGEKNQLAMAFKPDIWLGRVDDMVALGQHVRIQDRHQIDLGKAEVAARQATIKNIAKDKFKLKSKRKQP